MKTCITILFLGLAILHGAETKALTHRLDPNTIIYNGKEYVDPNPERMKFHNWYIDETKTNIDSRLVADFLSVIEDDKSFQNMSIMCFQPGLGFSISKDSKIYDYLVCLHCSNMEFYVDGVQVSHKSTLTSKALLRIKEIYESIWGKANKSIQSMPHARRD
jgi:hypothetical protein